MALTESCVSRLHNFKFQDAARELTETATDQERAVVEALAVFGNPGWFLGGQIEVVISAAISSITTEEGV